MTVKLTVEAHHTLILTHVLIIFSQEIANLIVTDESFLAVGRFMTKFTTVVTPDFVGRIIGIDWRLVGLIIGSS